MHAFINAAKKSGLAVNNFEIKNFRFKKFINPGEYPYSIEHSADELKCLLYDKDKKIAAMGEIVL